MARPRNYTEEMRETWVQMRLDGYSAREISEETGVPIPTIQGYFQDIGITHDKRPPKDLYPPEPDVLIKIHDLYLEPDAALRYFEVRAKLGLSCLDRAPLEGESIEDELERRGFLVIRKKSLEKAA